MFFFLSFFFQTLYFLSFFDLRFLIILLISSNFLLVIIVLWQCYLIIGKYYKKLNNDANKIEFRCINITIRRGNWNPNLSTWYLILLNTRYKLLISWQSAIVIDEIGELGENYWPGTNHWQTHMKLYSVPSQRVGIEHRCDAVADPTTVRMLPWWSLIMNIT